MLGEALEKEHWSVEQLVLYRIDPLGRLGEYQMPESETEGPRYKVSMLDYFELRGSRGDTLAIVESEYDTGRCFIRLLSLPDLAFLERTRLPWEPLMDGGPARFHFQGAGAGPVVGMLRRSPYFYTLEEGAETEGWKITRFPSDAFPVSLRDRMEQYPPPVRLLGRTRLLVSPEDYSCADVYAFQDGRFTGPIEHVDFHASFRQATVSHDGGVFAFWNEEGEIGLYIPSSEGNGRVVRARHVNGSTAVTVEIATSPAGQE